MSTFEPSTVELAKSISQATTEAAARIMREGEQPNMVMVSTALGDKEPAKAWCLALITTLMPLLFLLDDASDEKCMTMIDYLADRLGVTDTELTETCKAIAMSKEMGL